MIVERGQYLIDGSPKKITGSWGFAQLILKH